MQAFSFSKTALEPERYRDSLADAGSGGYASFEGWVRDHNEGKHVRHLEYEAFESLAIKEGARIVQEAIERFGVKQAACVHRVGDLAIGELAVWVGVSSAHRGEAFAACRYIIDEVKHRVPIWKKEHYTDGDSGWVNCERCAVPGHDHAHPHGGHVHHAHDEQASPAFAHDYSRQSALPEVGAIGQAKIRAASALVVGAGGLGVPVLQYLAAAGIGRIGIVDGDVVEASNLHRQPLYGISDVGQSKAQVAAARLADINRDVSLEVHAVHATAENVDALVAGYDLVVECSDNFRAKFLVNDAVVRAGKPAVFASVYQYEGQLQTYLPREDWPCLRCLWPEAPRDGLVGNCAQAGVLGPVPAALGALQAMEALKLVLGLGTEARPAVHVFDLLHLQWRTLRATRRTDCDHAPGGVAGRGNELTTDDTDLELEFPDLEAALASGLTLVDIREAWERDHDAPGQRIEMHLPLSLLLDGRAPPPPQGERYLIVCAHGVRSLGLTGHLRSMGYSDVYSLRGGLAALSA
jgi:molybdopterin/thiamine biosynthesis adenylyltransferase/molybdopterin synthase catalytic subunit/rhodanese-related sulfurtransferase